jgi:mannose-6-phosphate isomerase-like protein (cupin superfamily)
MAVVGSNVEHLWFLGTLVTVRVAADAGRNGISVLEHRAPYGDSAPLHIHHTEDEVFHVLEGEVRFRVEESERRAGLGDILIVPKGTPHTYRVESAGGARWLTITVGRDFEMFVRAMGTPAERVALPEGDEEPSPEFMQVLEDTARAHHIEIVGPPLA